MGALLHALHAHQPLPTGTYPTAKYPDGLPVFPPGPSPQFEPAGCEPAPAAPAVLTHLQPKPERIAAVKALGAEWLVAFEIDGPHEAAYYQCGVLPALPAKALVDKVKLGGKWFDASEAVPNFIDDIQEALDAMEWNA